MPHPCVQKAPLISQKKPAFLIVIHIQETQLHPSISECEDSLILTEDLFIFQKEENC